MQLEHRRGGEGREGGEGGEGRVGGMGRERETGITLPFQYIGTT